MSAHQASVGGHLSSVAVSSSRASEADREERRRGVARGIVTIKHFSRARLGETCAEPISALSFLAATTSVAAWGCKTAILHPVMSPLSHYQPRKSALRVTATDFQRDPGISRYRDEVGPFPFRYPLMGPTSLAICFFGRSGGHEALCAGQPGEGKKDADSSLCLPIVTSLVLLRKPRLLLKTLLLQFAGQTRMQLARSSLLHFGIVHSVGF